MCRYGDRTASGVQLAYAFDITKQVQGALSSLDLMVKVVDGDLTDGTFVRLFGHNSAYAPKFVVTYDPAYVTNPNARTHTHEIGRFGQGSVDLYRGNLTWECEDFAWSGNRLPVTLKHRFNSALAGKQYTAGSVEGLHVADFSAMKIGTGFALNVMQSVVPTYKEDGVTVAAYHYVDENGVETVLTAHTDESGTVTHYADEDEVYTYTPATRALTCGDETLTFDDAGRLVEIKDGYNNTQTVTYEDGRITAVTDGAGRVFAFAYDSTGHLTSITAPGNNTAVQYTYDGDLLTAVTYPDGRAAAIGYDDEGVLPEAVTLRDMAGVAIYAVGYVWENGCITDVTEYGYSADGEMVQGNVTTFDYDPVARRTVVTVTEAADGDEGENVIRTVYNFDDSGEVVSEYMYTEDIDNTAANGFGGGIHPYANGANSVPSSINLLKNHAFIAENPTGNFTALTDSDPWQPMPNNHNQTVTSYYSKYSSTPHGKGVLYIGTLNVESDTIENGAYQEVADLPQGDYTFSAYVKINRAYESDDVSSYLRVVDHNGVVLAQSEKIKENTEWTRLAVPFTLADTTTVQVQLLADKDGATYINAPQLESNAYATAYNSLENGCFEYSTDNWTSENITPAISTAEHFNGTQSLTITSAPTQKCDVYQEVIVKTEANTRETFTLSGWAKGESFPDRERNGDEVPRFRLCAEVVYEPEIPEGKTEAVTETELFTADFRAITEDWQFSSVQFCKSKHKPVQSVRVYADYSYNLGTAYFDNVQLVRNMMETDLSDEDFLENSEGTAVGTAEESTVPAFEEKYDAYGNPLTETTFTNGELGTIYRAFSYRNGYEIAEREGNDLVSETDARGNVTTYDVNDTTSRNEVVTDRLGNKTAYTYDAAGRVTRVANTSVDEMPCGTVEYAYDTFDNLTAITRGDSMQYALAYNPFHNLESIGVQGAEKPLVSYAYKNGNGRLKEITYANGDKMTATYNSAGQLVAEKWFDVNGTSIAHYKYVYDGDGNIVRTVDFGAGKEYTYIYEEGVLSRAAEYTVTVGENEIITSRTLLHTLQYTYNREGDLVRKQFVTADGTEHTVSFEKAEDRTVAHFTVQGKDIVSHSKTDTFGRKTFDELQLGSGFLTRRFAYHDGVVTREHAENGKVKSSPTTQLVSEITFSDGRTIAYEYDAEERITKVTDSVDGVTEYTYDALGQLLTEKVNGDIVNRMTYDSYGNILSKNGVQYVYDEVWRDKLLSVGGESMSYDAGGNPVVYRGRNLEWEKGRQLKCFGAHYYTYNANGIRTSKNVYTAQGYHSRHDYELDGTKILRETWGGYTLIPLYDNEDAVCGIVYEGDAFYFQKNLQGDIIAITNHTGTIVARYSYDAWGVCKVKLDTSGCDIANINPFRYRGYYYDVETGLYYLQSRYYDPESGRFINADLPELLILRGCFTYDNLYVYCGNCCVKYKDPYGYWYQETGIANRSTLNSFVGKIDDYIEANSDSRIEKILKGTGEALLAAVIAKLSKTAAIIFEVVRIILNVWPVVPKINDELGAIRYVTDQILRKYSNSKYEYSVSLVFGSHVNQYALLVREKSRKRVVSTTIVNFRNNQIHSILRGFLVSLEVPLAKLNLRYKQQL